MEDMIRWRCNNITAHSHYYKEYYEMWNLGSLHCLILIGFQLKQLLQVQTLAVLATLRRAFCAAEMSEEQSGYFASSGIS